jgi:hypothetical protein
VRVNAQLIDAHSGAHLWADQFDTTLADLLQMQDEIAARIVSTVRYELLKAEAQKSAIATNPDARDLTIRCVSVTSKIGHLGKEAEAGYLSARRRSTPIPTTPLHCTSYPSGSLCRSCSAAVPIPGPT